MAKKPYKERDFKFETLQLHVGQEEADPATDARAVPIYQTSSYVFHNSGHAADRFALKEEGNIYSRLTNPTVEIFEKRIAALEGGAAAVATASGAAAVTYAIQNVALNGGHIVAAKNLYGGSYNLLAHTLPDFGITTTFVEKRYRLGSAGYRMAASIPCSCRYLSANCKSWVAICRPCACGRVPTAKR